MKIFGLLIGWFSTNAAGYWQIPVEEFGKENTAFITSQRLYEFNIISFGSTNSPATFQRFIDAGSKYINKIWAKSLVDLEILSWKLNLENVISFKS